MSDPSLTALDEFSRARIAEMLGVDEISMTQNPNGIVVSVRIGTQWLAQTIELGQFASASLIGGKLAALALRLRDAAGYSAAIDRKIQQIAEVYGMPQELLKDPSFLCDRCGHSSKEHGRNRGLACNGEGCDCLLFASPLPVKQPDAPRPTTRFEAIVAELEKP